MSKLQNEKLIKDAMATPKAPEELMNSVIERGKSIMEGRISEKTLRERDDLTQNEVMKHVASSVVGRLMLNAKMPTGETRDSLISSLVNNERFQKAASKDKLKVLLEIESGDFLKSLTKDPSVNKKSNIKEKEASQKLL